MEQEQYLRRPVVADFVEQRLGLAPERDQFLFAKLCEMLRQGRLAEANFDVSSPTDISSSRSSGRG